MAMALAGLWSGCSSPPSPSCRAGETQACLGAGRCAGAQACLLDGSGFGACDCGTSGGGTGGASGGGAGGGAGGGGDAGADAGATSDGGVPDAGMTDGGSADGGVADGGLGDAGASDGGPLACSSDFDCDSGRICSAGACVTGTPCVADYACQSLDPGDRCYRYGRQCVCDTAAGSVCRLRRGPCEACLSDLECGSDVVIFGPPDGAGAGRCKTLPNDTSGLKYCSYQRVGSCACGTVDDGTGYCRPQSNSCQGVACDVQLQCPSSLTCNGGDGGTSCSGTCGAAVDQVPVARLTACSPAMLSGDPDCALGLGSPASFTLSSIAPDEITVSGLNSTDDGRVVDYRFTLLPPIPGGATSAALASNGVRGSTLKTVLTIPAGATGTYRVGLEVWDDHGQRSAATAVMTLNISP